MARYGYEAIVPQGGSVLRTAGIVVFAICLVLIVAAIAAIKLGYVEASQLRSWVGSAGGVATATAEAQPATVQTAQATPAPAAAPAQSGRREVRITDERAIGDWRYSCAELDDGQRGCSIVQQIRQSEPRQMLLSWRILRTADGKIRTLIHTPQAVALNRGLAIDAGLEKPIVVPYEGCGDDSCVVSAALADDFIATLSGAETIAVLYTLRDGRPVRVPVSVNGLGEGITALKQ